MTTVTLKHQVQDRLLKDIIDKAKTKGDQFCVLVVDEASMRILSASLKMYDIADYGVALIEQLEKRRKPLPDLTAIYFLSPTETSVDHFMADWSATERMYKSAHLFFTSRTCRCLVERCGQTRCGSCGLAGG